MIDTSSKEFSTLHEITLRSLFINDPKTKYFSVFVLCIIAIGTYKTNKSFKSFHWNHYRNYRYIYRLNVQYFENFPRAANRITVIVFANSKVKISKSRRTFENIFSILRLRSVSRASTIRDQRKCCIRSSIFPTI